MDSRALIPPSTPKTGWRKGLRLCFVLFLGLSLKAQAADLQRLAEQLSELRAQVERLQQELDQAKSAHRQKLEALGAQIVQLEAEKRRQELALEKLKSQRQNLSQKLPEASDSDAQLSQTIRQGIAALRHYLDTSLPFKHSERIEALKELEGKLQANSAAPKSLANQLWTLVEDELRLTREIGLYRQILPVDGENALVETAKLGMVMLFFTTPDGRYGMAQRQQDHWSYTILTQKDEKQRVATLVDSLRKQIRQGYFELPNPLR
jgi:regulator of replication initiation timing